jgi:hypothetical protein
MGVPPPPCLAGVSIASGFVLVGLGAVTLAFGGHDSTTYGWRACWLLLAAAAFSVAYWLLTIARSAPPQI